MTTPLLEREVEDWLQSLPISTLRLASLLSVSVSLAEADVGRLAHEVWTAAEDTVSDRDVALVRSSPFVAEGVQTLALRPEVSVSVARRFRDSEPDRFLEAHQALLSVEEARLNETRGLGTSAERAVLHNGDPWVIEGRIAFYLAALDKDRAERAFGRTFAEAGADAEESRIPRSWLATLGIRQSYLLGEDSRSVMFMRAFREYTAGSRTKALEHFQAVFSGHRSRRQDEYDAISLHLWSAGQKHGSEAAVDNLRSSIEISDELALRTNLVMASNTLVYRLMAIDSLGEAVTLAGRNAILARELDDDYLLSWCLQTKGAVLREAWAQSGASPSGDEIAGVLAELDEAMRLSRELGGLETEVLAANTTLQLLALSGRESDALRFVSSFIDDVGGFARPESARRLGQSLGTLKRNVPGDLRADLEELLTRIDDW